MDPSSSILERLGLREVDRSALAEFASSSDLGRVVTDFGIAFEVLTEAGSVRAVVTGDLLRARMEGLGLTVGDWVALSREETPRVVRAVAPRRTHLVRRAAGSEDKPQSLAANVDTVFVVTALGSDFNPKRLERYVTIVESGCARPVIVLTKIDLVSAEGVAEALAELAKKYAYHATSPLLGTGLDALETYFENDQTVALLGSSGVGKTTLMRGLAGEGGAVGDVRRDGKGRHTTTVRSLRVRASGGCLVDTPGMRELGMQSSEAGLDSAFADVAAWLGQCRFDDCHHAAEPGCAIQEAVSRGEIPAERVARYLALVAESRDTGRRSLAGKLEAKSRVRSATKALRARLRDKGR